MPSKSERAASRQAQIRQRRRRGKGQSQDFDPGPEAGTGATPLSHEQEPVAGVQPGLEATTGAVAARPLIERRIRRGAIGQPVPAYQNLGTEFRQIGLIAGLLVVILVALTFVLRG